MHSSRRAFLRRSAQQGAAALTLGSLAPDLAQAFSPGDPALDSTVPARIKPDYVVRSVPQNMVWGYFGADVPPVMHVKDGAIVEIQTVNPSGVSRTDPEAFYKTNNLPLNDHAKEVIAILTTVKPEPSGIRGHMLAGPIFIDGAQPPHRVLPEGKAKLARS